jgi:hypothetical protein
MTAQERTRILEMIEEGTITPEEGLELLQALEMEDEERAPTGEEQAPAFVEEDFQRWKSWWLIPFWLGVGITVLGAGLMFWAWSARGVGFWFACSWLPFLIGVGALALSWSSRTSPWLHLRVEQGAGKRPRHIAFSFPLPLRVAAWFLRVFGRFIPRMDRTTLDEVILALEEMKYTDAPVMIHVDEGQEGDHVQIYLG